MSVIDEVTTRFVGNYYEVTDSTVTKYYYAGGSRIAMRKYTIPQNMEVEYFLGDHLGSTSITTDSGGDKVSEMRYTAWGEVRYSWTDQDLSTTPAYELTKYTFTGQYSYMDDPSTTSVTEGFGLIYYNTRWYDPALGRFAQADSLIPGAGNPQAWDRYAYANNNPVKYVDPSGHYVACSEYGEGCGKGGSPIEPPGTGAGTGGGNKDDEAWGFETSLTYGYHIGGSTGIIPDQNSDDLLQKDEVMVCGIPIIGTIPCLFVIVGRFPHINIQDTDANFWVHFSISYRENQGVVLSDMTLINYTDAPLRLSLIIEDGSQPYRSGPIGVYNGFGGDKHLPDPPVFSGNNPLAITLEYEQVIDTGSAPFPGPSTIYPDIRITLPSLVSLKYFMQTGQIYSNPFLP